MQEQTMSNQHDNVDAGEIAKFSQIADKWWDKNGEFKPLHDINPLRLDYIDGYAGLAGKRVLDVGCGAGSHALYLQNERGLEVTAIDLSAKAIEVCQLRGIRSARVQNVLDTSEKYDTLLLLMNGAGMCGRLKKMPAFFTHLKTLLNEGGQILTDSSDIIYMFDQNPDGSYDVPLYGDYYGELEYTVKYKGKREKPFNWLYVDYNTLQNVAHAVGLQCELVAQGEHYDYLARLF